MVGLYRDSVESNPAQGTRTSSLDPTPYGTPAEHCLHRFGVEPSISARLRMCSIVDHVLLFKGMALNVATLEAAALGESLGLPPETVFRVLSDADADGSSRNFLERTSGKAIRADYPTQTATADTWATAAFEIIRTAQRVGTSTRMITATYGAMSDAKRSGCGSDDLAVIFLTARQGVARSQM